MLFFPHFFFSLKPHSSQISLQCNIPYLKWFRKKNSYFAFYFSDLGMLTCTQDGNVLGDLNLYLKFIYVSQTPYTHRLDIFYMMIKIIFFMKQNFMVWNSAFWNHVETQKLLPFRLGISICVYTVLYGPHSPDSKFNPFLSYCPLPGH